MKHIFYYILTSTYFLPTLFASDTNKKQTSPIPISPRTSLFGSSQQSQNYTSPDSAYIQPGTSPSSSSTSAYSPASQTHYPSLSSSPTSPNNTAPFMRSVSMSPSSFYPATPSTSLVQQYEYLPFSNSNSPTPSAPPADTLNGNAKKSSISSPASATHHMPTAEKIAHTKVEDFKKFLALYPEADRAKLVTPLLDSLNCDACLVVAKVAAVRGTTHTDKTVRDLTQPGIQQHVKTNAHLALDALQKALKIKPQKKSDNAK